MLDPTHYFAYGSNMNPERVRKRKLPIQGHPMAARLFNFALKFNKISRMRPGTASANVVPELCTHTDGVLYELLDSDSIEVMDPFENSPADYAREAVVVYTSESQDPAGFKNAVLAWTYIAKEHAIQDGLRPTREYLGHLLASPFLVDTDRRQLEQVVCFDG